MEFLDERTGIKRLGAHLLDEPIKGGARWAYVFGSALLGSFMVQAVTGVALMTSYAPSDKTAWASVHFIQFQQAGGWLVRGLHHFGAQAMVILLGAHLAQVALFGAYKKPREVTWWLGLGLLAITLGFALTGYLLPWDQKGYWATRVATNIAGTVPVVGDATQRLLQGGPEYGSLTLTRFYTLHVVVLPALLVALVAAHVALFRRHGVTPPAKADLSRVDAFFPKQLFKDVVAVLAVVGIVFVLAIREHGAPLDAPADPSSDYPARPEWYFLALFQLLKYFHGPLEIVGTVVLPTLVGIYFFALPLLDAKGGTALRARVKPLLPLLIVGAGAVGLTVKAEADDARDATFQKDRARADRRASAAVKLAMDGVPPEGPLAMLARSPELRGPELFDQHCAACHRLGEHGSEKDRTAPVLDGWSSEAWILEMLRDPDGDARFGRTPYKGEMPSMDKKPEDADESWAPMPVEDMQAAAAFLASEGDAPGAAPPAGSLRADPRRVARGKEIVKTRCTTCHLFEGAGDDGGQGLAPELSGYGSHAWVRTQIANPASKATYREGALDPEREAAPPPGVGRHMPRFDDALSAAEIDLLTTWVLGQARR
ncbi:MAG: cytochrome b N-terminal domain-containing protein [Labilithrix sp.]|nr:cytochrome b N-terminal domain-containing protein [Labilithrix sp.]